MKYISRASPSIEAIGGRPDQSLMHPIRKRAFYRAWKRKELWAFVPYRLYAATCKLDEFAQVHADAMCQDDSLYVTWPFISKKSS